MREEAGGRGERRREESGKSRGGEKRAERAESREQRAESREQRAESREQRAESRKQKAESREQRAESKQNSDAAIPKNRGASESPTAQPGEAKPSGEHCPRITPR